MRREITVFAIAFSIMVTAQLTEAQQAKRIPRIGFLSGGFATTNPYTESFRRGLQALGYIEGKNIVIEWRFAEENPERYPELGAELVHLGVKVIVTSGSASTRAAKAITTTIPIVMGQDPDPVGNGYIASFSLPGGNITGLSNYSAELSGKRLELLKEIIPRLSRVAVFGDSDFPGNAQALSETELAAKAFAVQIQHLDVQGHKEIETLFRAAKKGRADAVLILGGHILSSQRTRLAELAAKSRLPTMNPSPFFVQAGGLVAYGVSRTDLFRRAATYVDKILKGAKPAELPVEQPTKFDLVINLKTAKQLGITIPPIVLYQATKVIR